MVMGRCIYCYHVVTDQEDRCTYCGDTLLHKQASRARIKSPPVSGWTNTVFIGSLAFVAYWFFVEQGMTLPVALTLSCTLVLLRLVAEWVLHRHAAKH